MLDSKVIYRPPAAAELGGPRRMTNVQHSRISRSLLTSSSPRGLPRDVCVCVSGRRKIYRADARWRFPRFSILECESRSTFLLFCRRRVVCLFFEGFALFSGSCSSRWRLVILCRLPSLLVLHQSRGPSIWHRRIGVLHQVFFICIFSIWRSYQKETRIISTHPHYMH